jgi:hypothetical protein
MISQKTISPQIELATTTTASIMGSTHREFIVQARATSPGIWRAFTGPIDFAG